MIKYRKGQLNTIDNPALEAEIKICVYITLIANFFVLLGKPYEINVLVSWPTRFTIILPVVLAVVMFFNYLRRDRLKPMELCFLGIILFSVLGVAVSGASALLGKIVEYMCFLMLPAYGILFREVKSVKPIKIAIFIANFFYAGLFVFLSFTDIAYRYVGEYGIEYTYGMTLGYANPNETGMYLLVSFAIMLSLFFYTDKLYVKALAALFGGYLFYCIVMTESRICLILVILLLIVQFTGWIRRTGKNTAKIVTLIPAIFAVILIFAPSFLDSLQLMGDSLEGGRSAVIKPFLAKLDFSVFLFGDFSEFAGHNLHNSYVTKFAFFGIFTVIVYTFFLQNMLHEYRARLSDKCAWCAYAAFLCIILHGIAEATFITSGTVYAGLVGLLLLLMLPGEQL